MAKNKEKTKKFVEKQQKIELEIDTQTKFSEFKYKFGKIESLLEISPFWKSPLVWFLISAEIFVSVILFFFLNGNISLLPEKIPFLYFEAEGAEQLIDSFWLWYFFIGFVATSLINVFFLGRLFINHREVSWFIVLVEFLKIVLFPILIYKTVTNWI